MDVVGAEACVNPVHFRTAKERARERAKSHAESLEDLFVAPASFLAALESGVTASCAHAPSAGSCGSVPITRDAALDMYSLGATFVVIASSEPFSKQDVQEHYERLADEAEEMSERDGAKPNPSRAAPSFVNRVKGTPALFTLVNKMLSSPPPTATHVVNELHSICGTACE
jgi:hypothetical protein